MTFVSFGLGMATGFAFRDELTMPTYMRIKMATVEHSILSRKRISTDLLKLIDVNSGKGAIEKQSQRVFDEREKLEE